MGSCLINSLEGFICAIRGRHSRHYSYRQLREGLSATSNQTAQETSARGSWNVDDVVWLQLNVFGLSLLNGRQVDQHFLFRLSARLLAHDAYLVLFRVLPRAAGHRDRAAHRDWFLQRNSQRHDDVADDVNLIGVRERHDVAGFQVRIRLRLAEQRVAETVTGKGRNLVFVCLLAKGRRGRVHNVDCLSGLCRWTFRVGQQLEQPHSPLQLETSLFVDGANDCDLPRLILPDVNVYLEVAVELRVARGDLFRELTFGQTRCLYFRLDERHANHAVALDANRFTRQLRPVVNAHVKHV